jgi:hypothetical protein
MMPVEENGSRRGGGGRMLYDELWETAMLNDWRLATVEHKALAVGAFIVGAVLIWDRIRAWKRTRRMEIGLKRMEKKIYILEIQESGRLTRLVRELNAKSRVKVDARDTAVEVSDSGDTASAISPLAAADQRESGKPAKLTSSRRPILCRKAVAQRQF